MKLRRPTDQRIFFPWERRGGLRRRLGLGRARPVLLVLLLLGFVVWVGARERTRAGVRQTRATLLHVRKAVDAYVADHDGACPPSLAAVAPYGKFSEPPTDAWGRPLRLVCPARHEGARYELLSDGPDGKPGGLDRIE
jgi:general secretion pathway protein G